MKTEREVSETEIVEIAGRYLKDKHPGGATLEALTQGVQHEQDWWYIPGRPSFEPPRRYEYYEALADVEGALEDEENLTVLFLPTAPETTNRMKDEYDFSNAKRGAVVPLPPHQKEIRLRLDNEVIDWLRKCANEANGGSYQDIINSIFQAHIDAQEDAALIRAIREGEGSGKVRREEVFAMLQRQN